MTFLMKTFPLGESNLGQYVEKKQKTRHRRVVSGIIKTSHCCCCCCCSVTQSCVTLWDSMDCRTPGLPVPHYVLEFAQVLVH